MSNELFRSKSRYTMYFLPGDPREKRTDIEWCARIEPGELLILVEKWGRLGRGRTFLTKHGLVQAQTSDEGWEILMERIA